MLPEHYLVELDPDHEHFEEFSELFHEHQESFNLCEWLYAGPITDEEGGLKWDVIDDIDDFKYAEDTAEEEEVSWNKTVDSWPILSLDQWKQMKGGVHFETY